MQVDLIDRDGIPLGSMEVEAVPQVGESLGMAGLLFKVEQVEGSTVTVYALNAQAASHMLHMLHKAQQDQDIMHLF